MIPFHEAQNSCGETWHPERFPWKLEPLDVWPSDTIISVVVPQNGVRCFLWGEKVQIQNRRGEFRRKHMNVVVLFFGGGGLMQI